MALKHSSSSLLEISTAQRASRLCWGMKARVWSSGWSRLTGEKSPWTLRRGQLLMFIVSMVYLKL